MDGEGSLIGLLCSQTAHDQNVLPREKARLGAPRAGRGNSARSGRPIQAAVKPISPDGVEG